MEYIFEGCEYSESLIERIHQFNIQASYFGHDMVDVELVKKAVAFAKHWHHGQTRKSGEPYYSHTIAVASMAMEHKFTTDVICGALLHDVLEDTKCTYKIICQEFSFRIAEIVCRLTRKFFGSMLRCSVEDKLLESLRSRDEDAVLIKVSDRLHNLMTIRHMDPDKQTKLILETLKSFVVPSVFLDELKITELKKICYSYLNINTFDLNDFQWTECFLDSYRILSLSLQNVYIPKLIQSV